MPGSHCNITTDSGGERGDVRVCEFRPASDSYASQRLKLDVEKAFESFVYSARLGART